MSRVRGNPTWPGPRLGSTGKPKPGTPAELIDPAMGEAVARCRICGLPDAPTHRLLRGIWSLGAFAIPLVLCERELPPFDPSCADPLVVVA